MHRPGVRGTAASVWTRGAAHIGEMCDSRRWGIGNMRDVRDWEKRLGPVRRAMRRAAARNCSSPCLPHVARSCAVAGRSFSAAPPIEQEVACVHIRVSQANAGPRLDSFAQFGAVLELPVGEEESSIRGKQFVDSLNELQT